MSILVTLVLLQKLAQFSTYIRSQWLPTVLHLGHDENFEKKKIIKRNQQWIGSSPYIPFPIMQHLKGSLLSETPFLYPSALYMRLGAAQPHEPNCLVRTIRDLKKFKRSSDSCIGNYEHLKPVIQKINKAVITIDERGVDRNRSTPLKFLLMTGEQDIFRIFN